MLIYNLFPVFFFFFSNTLRNPGRDSVPQAWQIEHGMVNTNKDKGRKLEPRPLSTVNLSVKGT